MPCRPRGLWARAAERNEFFRPRVWRMGGTGGLGDWLKPDASGGRSMGFSDVSGFWVAPPRTRGGGQVRSVLAVGQWGFGATNFMPFIRMFDPERR